MQASERPLSADSADCDRVFILRFWIERESTSDSVPIWRAKVSDVAGGVERHINGVDGALDYVRTFMNGVATSPHSNP